MAQRSIAKAIKISHQRSEVIYPERYSLWEQCAIYSSTRFLVGASGAAWANMIFCDRGLRGLSWLPNVYGEFATYASLAEALGHEIDFLTCEMDRPIKSTKEAYSAGYRSVFSSVDNFVS